MHVACMLVCVFFVRAFVKSAIAPHRREDLLPGHNHSLPNFSCAQRQRKLGLGIDSSPLAENLILVRTLNINRGSNSSGMKIM